jgi:hypothetical protein
MVFGRLRKVWEKIKGGAKKVFGFVKDKVLPFIKPLVPMVGAALGGPAGAAMGSSIVNGVEGGINTLFPSLNKNKGPVFSVGPVAENRRAPTWGNRV